MLMENNHRFPLQRPNLGTNFALELVCSFIVAEVGPSQVVQRLGLRHKCDKVYKIDFHISHSCFIPVKVISQHPGYGIIILKLLDLLKIFLEIQNP